VEPDDCSLRAAGLTATPLDVDDVALRVTALRETAEEAGLLLTVPPTDQPVVVAEGGFFDLLEREGRRLDGESLRLLSRWVTPEYAPVRFDTWFYLTVVTTRQAPIPRAGEIMDARWVRPPDALAKVEAGEWSMVTPTIHHLRWLASFPDSAAIWRSARRGSRNPVEPVIEDDGSEVRIRLPDTARLP
jgi:8-oxo-dGTP pyrophosphatase MutT (NUDIX family)